MLERLLEQLLLVLQFLFLVLLLARRLLVLLLLVQLLVLVLRLLLAMPELPTLPIISPFFTTCPSLTKTELRWRYADITPCP